MTTTRQPVAGDQHADLTPREARRRFREGELVEETSDATPWWRDDLVP